MGLVDTGTQEKRGHKQGSHIYTFRRSPVGAGTVVQQAELPADAPGKATENEWPWDWGSCTRGGETLRELPAPGFGYEVAQSPSPHTI